GSISKTTPLPSARLTPAPRSVRCATRCPSGLHSVGEKRMEDCVPYIQGDRAPGSTVESPRSDRQTRTSFLCIDRIRIASGLKRAPIPAPGRNASGFPSRLQRRIPSSPAVRTYLPSELTLAGGGLAVVLEQHGLTETIDARQPSQLLLGDHGENVLSVGR